MPLKWVKEPDAQGTQTKGKRHGSQAAPLWGYIRTGCLLALLGIQLGQASWALSLWGMIPNLSKEWGQLWLSPSDWSQGVGGGHIGGGGSLPT